VFFLLAIVVLLSRGFLACGVLAVSTIALLGGEGKRLRGFLSLPGRLETVISLIAGVPAGSRGLSRCLVLARIQAPAFSGRLS